MNSLKDRLIVKKNEMTAEEVESMAHRVILVAFMALVCISMFVGYMVGKI